MNSTVLFSFPLKCSTLRKIGLLLKDEVKDSMLCSVMDGGCVRNYSLSCLQASILDDCSVMGTGRVGGGSGIRDLTTLGFFARCSWQSNEVFDGSEVRNVLDRWKDLLSSSICPGEATRELA